MRIASDWKDFEVLDCLRRRQAGAVGGCDRLIRPDPQVIWNTPKGRDSWKKANARYLRSSERRRKLGSEQHAGPASWEHRLYGS